MGQCSSSRTAHRDVISPQGDNHAQIEVEFAAQLMLKNPHNINHKYTYLYKPIEDAWTGRTIKKTHAYISFVSLAEIRKKREEFWETRVEGCADTWNALKLTCQQEEVDDNVLAVLKAAGVKQIDKTIQMCYDDNMYKYDIPIFLINDPKDYKINDDSKKEYVQKDIKIKIRQGGSDVELIVHTSEKISSIMEKYLKKSDKSPDEYKCRLLFGGKELLPSNGVGVYIQNDCVLQGFTSKLIID